MRNSLWIVIWLCCCLPAWSAGSTQAPPAQQAAQLLTQAQQQPAQRTALLRQAAALVPSEATPALQDALRKPTADKVALAQREVSALSRIAPLPSTATLASKRSPHDVLHSVLARAEFRTLKNSPPPGMTQWFAVQLARLQRQISAFFNTIGRFFGWLFQKIHPPRWMLKPSWMHKLSSPLRTTIYVLLIASVLLLVGLLVYRFTIRSLRRNAQDVNTELLGEDGPVSPKQEPTYWERSLVDAEALWQQGDERKALRVLYWACLVLMDTRGILRFDETRANGEVLRELRKRGLLGMHEHLRPVVRSFDRCWYGFLSLSNEEFTQALDSSRRFRGAVVEDQ